MSVRNSAAQIHGAKRLSRLSRKSKSVEGIDFVRCRICGDHRRVLSARHLSKHGTDREEYMEEYSLSPDDLIAKDFRRIQSSRRGYQPYGRREWIAAIKKIHGQGGSILARDLQRSKHQNLYHLGVCFLVIGIRRFVQRDLIQNRCGYGSPRTERESSRECVPYRSEIYRLTRST
jgi:hypothetical protein